MGKLATLIAALSTLGFLAESTSGFAGPVHEAARDGNLIQLEQLIAKDPKSVNSQDNHHFSPLHWAAANGHTDVIPFVLDHGADPNARTDIGMTPLLLVNDRSLPVFNLSEADRPVDAEILHRDARSSWRLTSATRTRRPRRLYPSYL